MIHPKWPMLPGTRDVYQRRRIAGQFDPNTGEIGITSHGDFDTPELPRLAIWNIAVVGWPAANPLIARVHVPPDHQMPTVPINPGSLYETRWMRPLGFSYVGEFTGHGVVQAPPIPVYRDAGPPVINVDVRVQWYDAPERYSYMECAHIIGLDAAPWGPGAERNALIERHANYSIVYNQVIRDGALVDQWFGNLADDNTVDGLQYYRIGT